MVIILHHLSNDTFHYICTNPTKKNLFVSTDPSANEQVHIHVLNRRFDQCYFYIYKFKMCCNCVLLWLPVTSLGFLFGVIIFLWNQIGYRTFIKYMMLLFHIFKILYELFIVNIKKKIRKVTSIFHDNILNVCFKFFVLGFS